MYTKGAYKVIYIVDGEDYKTIGYDFGDAITPEAEPTKEGYTFSGWNEIPATMPAEDVTVTGTFTINKYKLVYLIDGEEYKTFEVEYGARITPESEPIKEGYTFSGWSKIPETMPAIDVTVIGTFTEDEKPQSEVTIDHVTYEISSEGTAMIKSSEQKGQMQIEPIVEINGQIYQVTGIAEGAFKNNKDITSLTIPEGVTTIGDDAFNGCSEIMVINIGSDVNSIGKKAFANIVTSSVRTREESPSIIVNCYAVSVPQTAIDAFEKTPIETGILYVEDNSVDAYKTVSPWNRFGKIIGFKESTGIYSVINDIQGARIYDLQGNRLDNVRKGLNIIRTEDGKVRKVVVK